MDRFKQCLLTLLNRITLFIHKVWYAKWLVLGCILLFIPLSFYIYTFGSNGISGDTEKWAQFGDYIGVRILCFFLFWLYILPEN